MDAPERQLIDGLKSNNQESFAILFNQYSKKIYCLAFRMCGNNEDAEDIVQNTFVKAFMNIHGFKEESSLYTWLYAIAKNLCLRLLENRKRSSFSSLESLIQTAQATSDDFTQLEKQYYIRQVKDGCLLGLLGCLPFYQRIAFTLNVLLEVKVKDVSMILDKSETATRLLVHRARQNIRNFLCKNCSLYRHGNACHCENLINFSLNQGWIQKMPDNESPQLTPMDIEREINDLKKITLLYQSLEDRPNDENMIHLIQARISESAHKIFFL